jgi:membrane protein implicated in regulation of membrane protease activity
MYTPAQHGAAIASQAVAGASSSPNGGGWVTLVQAGLSLAIVLALAILWWRTLRPERPAKQRDQMVGR